MVTRDKKKSSETSKAASKKKRARTKKSLSNKKSLSKKKLTRKKASAVGKKRPARNVALRLELAWKATPEAQKVIDTTQDVFDNTAGAKSDCNKFVKAVCDKLTTNPFADGEDADAITNDIRSDTWRTANGWTGLKEDPAEAKKAADRGDLVIGGATGEDLGQNHGHVVVVVSSESLWKGYGYASWGKLGGTGKVNEKLTVAFKLADLPNVSYMSKAI
jgi:hypothetical protein